MKIELGKWRYVLAWYQTFEVEVPRPGFTFLGFQIRKPGTTMVPGRQVFSTANGDNIPDEMEVPRIFERTFDLLRAICVSFPMSDDESQMVLHVDGGTMEFRLDDVTFEIDSAVEKPGAIIRVELRGPRNGPLKGLQWESATLRFRDREQFDSYVDTRSAKTKPKVVEHQARESDSDDVAAAAFLGGAVGLAIGSSDD